MARASTNMKKVREIFRPSHIQGLSIREISNALGVSRPTVSEYLSKLKDAGLTYEDILSFGDDELQIKLNGTVNPRIPAKEKPDYEYIHMELKKPNVTLTILWDEYINLYPNGYRYSQFCQYYRDYKATLDTVMRFNHKASRKDVC